MWVLDDRYTAVTLKSRLCCIGGATQKFLAGPNLRPRPTFYKRSVAYNSQHWDWG